jgi:hypothetical protein
VCVAGRFTLPGHNVSPEAEIGVAGSARAAGDPAACVEEDPDVDADGQVALAAVAVRRAASLDIQRGWG